MQTEGLATLYSSKSDDELIALAADRNSLAEEARSVLDDELLRRNITPTKAFPAYTTTEKSQLPIPKLMKTAGALLLNLVIAIVGTAVIESPIWSVWSQMQRTHTLTGIVVRAWFLGLTIAGLLGFFVGRRRPKTATWIWTVPLAFFGFGALMYMTRPHGSVLLNDGGFASHFFAPKCLDYSCGWRDFFLFTIPAARSIMYSVGAKFWVHLQIRTASSDVRSPVV